MSLPPGSDIDCDMRLSKNDFEKVLASEGVEFLISSDRKEIPLFQNDYATTTCLFFSANWCRPCQAFLPHLVQVYNSLINAGEKLEVIFISFDRDEDSFNEHFKSMPWLAVPFNVHLHKKISSHFNVFHIPTLLPLSMDGKSPVEENAVDLIEDYGADAFPFTRERRGQLKAMDDEKRKRGKIEELLASGKSSYLVTKDGSKVLVSELMGKTIGLYFGAYWCPPSRIFSTQLIDAYNKLIADNSTPFEVIFISTDRDHDEFDNSLSAMPWLAVPYEDKTRQDLKRIFEIKGIPTLVLIGADGKLISANGRSLVSAYGALAFPFTEASVGELETALRKEGENLPQVVKYVNHEHELKLEMAKAYMCDACGCRGKFWAFTCDACNYDLHPSCLDQSSA
ncbi:hypothetical protein Droror1_Dr00017082 [Drosera rotundifolia]